MIIINARPPHQWLTELRRAGPAPARLRMELSLGHRIREAGLIGKEWLGQSQFGKTFEVTNPSTNEVLATLARSVMKAERAQL